MSVGPFIPFEACQPDLKYFFILFPSQMQLEFDKLDRQARQLSDQLAEVTKQKKAAAAASKDDHPPTSSSSSSSSSSASSKKSTSSEYRDIIHQLEGKLSMTRGEQAKLEKDNQRLKNSITVRNTHIHTPVPSCVHAVIVSVCCLQFPGRRTARERLSARPDAAAPSDSGAGRGGPEQQGRHHEAHSRAGGPQVPSQWQGGQGQVNSSSQSIECNSSNSHYVMAMLSQETQRVAARGMGYQSS